MKKIFIGDIAVTMLDDGVLWLDGGAMFGVVPRVLWEKHMPPDGRNRVLLGLVCPLIESQQRRVLVDTGAGRKQTAKLKEIYGLDDERTLLHALSEVDLDPGQVDVVVNTHLHFDHSGWNTRSMPDGAVEPTFPNAEYVIQRSEWEAARQPDPRSAPAYPRENLETLSGANLQLVDGECELAKGVYAQPSPGHTCGHQCVRIESQGQIAVFLGDLIPTPHHLKPAYHMAYDLYPLQTMETKKSLLDRAIQDRWLLLFDHDPDHRIGYVSKSRSGELVFEEI